MTSERAMLLGMESQGGDVHRTNIPKKKKKKNRAKEEIECSISKLGSSLASPFLSSFCVYPLHDDALLLEPVRLHASPCGNYNSNKTTMSRRHQLKEFWTKEKANEAIL